MENLQIFLKAWCPKEESLPFFPRTVQMKETGGFPGVERKKLHHDVSCTTARSWPLPDTEWCLNFLLLFVSYCPVTSLSVTVPQLFSHCSAHCSALLQTAMINTLVSREQSPTHKHRYINWLYMPFACFILWNVMDANNSYHKIDPFCCCTCPIIHLKFPLP